MSFGETRRPDLYACSEAPRPGAPRNPPRLVDRGTRLVCPPLPPSRRTKLAMKRKAKSQGTPQTSSPSPSVSTLASGTFDSTLASSSDTISLSDLDEDWHSRPTLDSAPSTAPTTPELKGGLTLAPAVPLEDLSSVLNTLEQIDPPSPTTSVDTQTSTTGMYSEELYMWPLRAPSVVPSCPESQESNATLRASRLSSFRSLPRLAFGGSGNGAPVANPKTTWTCLHKLPYPGFVPKQVQDTLCTGLSRCTFPSIELDYGWLSDERVAQGLATERGKINHIRFDACRAGIEEQPELFAMMRLMRFLEALPDEHAGTKRAFVLTVVVQRALIRQWKKAEETNPHLYECTDGSTPQPSRHFFESAWAALVTLAASKRVYLTVEPTKTQLEAARKLARANASRPVKAFRERFTEEGRKEKADRKAAEDEPIRAMGWWGRFFFRDSAAALWEKVTKRK